MNLSRQRKGGNQQEDQSGEYGSSGSGASDLHDESELQSPAGSRVVLRLGDRASAVSIDDAEVQRQAPLEALQRTGGSSGRLGSGPNGHAHFTAGSTAILWTKSSRTGSFASPPYDGFAFISV